MQEATKTTGELSKRASVFVCDVLKFWGFGGRAGNEKCKLNTESTQLRGPLVFWLCLTTGPHMSDATLCVPCANLLNQAPTERTVRKTHLTIQGTPEQWVEEGGALHLSEAWGQQHLT